MQSGQSLGPYRILEPLGAGGMGEVYLAEDTRLGRKVAIKVLPAGVATNAESLARLEQEARLLAQLEHPNVATVYGLEEARLEGVDEPVRHLVMQVAEGEPLSDRLAAGALPPDEALEIACQIAAGVGAAHDKGIIHRDLKPANVMVAEGPGGRPAVKVLDFGLAKALEGDATGKANDLTASPTMAAATAAGMIMGTAAYMSPEQARGKPVDRRTDVWAFGCLLYEMLTGQAAFGGETVSDIIAAILTREPDWAALPPALPNTASRALRRCLASEIDLRPYDVRDVVLELRADETDAPIAAEPGSDSGEAPAPIASSRARQLAFAGLALIVALAGYMFGRLGSTGSAANPASGQAVPTRHTQITFQQGVEAFPSVTPDGDWIVYASRVDGDWDVYLQAVGGDNAINLTADSPEDDWMPALSPDGRQIAFRSERGDGGIYVMGRTGESVRRLTDAGFNPAWSPDARRLAVTTERISNTPYGRESQSLLQLVDVSSGAVSVLATGDAVQASFSPDGRWLVYWGSLGGQRDLWLAPVEGGDPIRLLDDAPTDWSPVFTPDGGAIVFSSDRGGSPGLWQLPLDPATHAPLGPPAILVPGNSAWIAYPTFASASGQLFYATMKADFEVQQVVFDDSLREIAEGPLALTSGARHVGSPDLSPDGQWIAFHTGHGQQEDIYLQRVDGTGTRRLTDDAFKDRAPRFSPDGRTLAFYGARDGDYRIWTIGVDGSGLRAVSGEADASANYAVWSPAGDRIATTTGYGPGTSKPVVLTLEPQAQSLTLDIETPAGLVFQASDWSQDGERLLGNLLVEVSGGSRGTMVFNLQTGVSRRLTDFGARPVWLLDDRHVASITDDEIWISDSVSGDSWRILSIFPDSIVEYIRPLPSELGVIYSARHQEDDLWMAEWE